MSKARRVLETPPGCGRLVGVDMQDATCAHCGTPTHRRGKTGPSPKYCSPGCRSRAGYARAKADGRVAAAIEARRKVRTPTRHQLVCCICEAAFEAKRKDTKYCSPRCARQGSPNRCTHTGCDRPVRAKLLCNTHYNSTYHQGSQRRNEDMVAKRKRDLIRAKRRRAVTRGSTAEDVDRQRVGDRDGWCCGICGHRVDQALPYPDPMSQSLDHVVPIAEGGPHTYANTRITHLACNLTRGDRGGGEQLALVG